MIGCESRIGKAFASGADGGQLQFRVEIAAPHDGGGSRDEGR